MSGRISFNWDTATTDERLLEVRRRELNRAAGRAPTDDGPAQAEGPRERIFREIKEGTSTKVILAGRRGGKTAAQHLSGAFVGAEAVILPAVHLTLPWSHLSPDNTRFVPALRGTKAVLLMKETYRVAKKRACERLLEQWTSAPLAGRVRLTAMLWEPNRSTTRDITNYAKLVHDALTCAKVIADDSQLDDVRWIRAGVDIDAPRVELTLGVLL